jgi:uncharacterized MAPEG superfamily protein
MLNILLVSLAGILLARIAFHALAWLIPRLVRVFPVLLGGAMAASMIYALGQIALHP